MKRRSFTSSNLDSKKQPTRREMLLYPQAQRTRVLSMSESIHAVSPMRIEKLLADNGSRFPTRFAGKRMKPSGRHAIDGESALLGIEHRLIKPRHPQTMGRTLQRLHKWRSAYHSFALSHGQHGNWRNRGTR